MKIPDNTARDLRGQTVTDGLYVGAGCHVVGGIMEFLGVRSVGPGSILEQPEVRSCLLGINLPPNGHDVTLIEPYIHDIEDSGIVANGPGKAGVAPEGHGLAIRGGRIHRTGTKPEFGTGKAHGLYSQWRDTSAEGVDFEDWDGAGATFRQANGKLLDCEFDGAGRGQLCFTFDQYDVIGGVTELRRNKMLGATQGSVSFGAWEPGWARYYEQFVVLDNNLDRPAKFGSFKVIAANNANPKAGLPPSPPPAPPPLDLAPQIAKLQQAGVLVTETIAVLEDTPR